MGNNRSFNIISQFLLGLLFFCFMSFAINGSSYRVSAVTVNQALLLAQKIDCQNAQSTAAMSQCAVMEAEKADQKLNQTYQQLKSKLPTSQKKRLTDAQLAWINFRDKDCAFAGGEFEGGSFAPVAETLCLARVTNQRVSDLNGYLEDLSNR